MVRLRRLELPRGVNPTATSTLRVYQFRHSRTLFRGLGVRPATLSHQLPPKSRRQNQAAKINGPSPRHPYPRDRNRGEAYSPRHFIEQPTDGVCAAGPAPVLAIWRIASKSSALRSPFAPIFKSSSSPRYCKRSSAFSPKKSGVQIAP